MNANEFNWRFFVILRDWGHQTCSYMVAPGESLFSISRRYGTSIDQLRAFNGLASFHLGVGMFLHCNPLFNSNKALR